MCQWHQCLWVSHAFILDLPPNSHSNDNGARQSLADLGGHVFPVDKDTILLWVILISNTHDLDLDLACFQFLLAQYNRKGHASRFCLFELLRQLWLELIRKLGLDV